MAHDNCCDDDEPCEPSEEQEQDGDKNHGQLEQDDDKNHEQLACEQEEHEDEVHALLDGYFHDDDEEALEHDEVAQQDDEVVDGEGLVAVDLLAEVVVEEDDHGEDAPDDEESHQCEESLQLHELLTHH